MTGPGGFGEAAFDEQAFGHLTVIMDIDNAGPQVAENRRVAGKHAEITVGAGNDDHVDLFRGEQGAR